MLEQMIKSQKRKDAQEKAKGRGPSKSSTRTVMGQPPGGKTVGYFGDIVQAPIHTVDTRTGQANMPFAPERGDVMGGPADPSPSGASPSPYAGNVAQSRSQFSDPTMQLQWMEAMGLLDNRGAAAGATQPLSREKGIALVPETGPANLHRGEAVISAPIVKKVMGGEYPEGTTGTAKKPPRDYKQVILEGAKSYEHGTGDPKKQEGILEAVLAELAELVQPGEMGEGALEGQFFGGGLGEETIPEGMSLLPETGLEPGEKFVAGQEYGGPPQGGPPTEDITAPEEAPFAGEETNIGQLMGGITDQPTPDTGYDEITESVGAGGERKFDVTGDPNAPKGPSAQDLQKKQLESLNEQARSMYTSAVTLATYANERPNSPAAQYLNQQSQERMKASKQLQMMYQQGLQTQQAVEQQEAEREAQEVAAQSDAQARETQAKYESEDRQRKLRREDRGESTKQIASLAKSLAGLEGGDAQKTEDILNQLIMYYMQQGGGFQGEGAGVAGGE